MDPCQLRSVTAHKSLNSSRGVISEPDQLTSPEAEILEGFYHRGVIQGKELQLKKRTATAGSDVVQSGRPIFDDFFQHLWPYIGNNTVNVIFQIVKRLWLIRIDQ
ncbi:hypothetical protein TNCV_4314841 [Trichonephila clavipes]|nr:hypothetical protein TNCV_4314841 [Trichonephila clavipes]